MRAFFTGSTASTTSQPDSVDAQVYSPPPPTVSVSSADPPRRIKSKSSLRSIRSIASEDEPPNSPDQAPDKDLVRPSILRRLSPGLAARVKLLDGSNKSATTSRSHGAVGRIPEEHLKELDSQHQNFSIRVEKRGRAWQGLSTEQELSTNSLRPELVPEPAQTSSEPVVNLPDRTIPEPENEPRKSDPEDTPAMSVVEPSAPVPDPEPAANTGQTDFEKYLQKVEDEELYRGRTTVRGDRAPSMCSSNGHSLHRTESIYSFSKDSFSSQIDQLTSISLPQPSTLEATIAGISNAPAAVKALAGAAEQIRDWIKKASGVLNDLNADDDIEWAAAAGRAGLDDVDKAITKFESVVNVYVKAIEEVQLREDIGNVSSESLNTTVNQMESILKRWALIRQRLKEAKHQVELAMEWEELWESVLGDVGKEVESLNDLVFEMEEKRHRSLFIEPDNAFDINELETIVEETPADGKRSSKRLSVGQILNASTLGTPAIPPPQDESNNSSLMGLYARMQPLRASLDFLPMRLSMFSSRAGELFPSACEELEDRRNRLERSYKTLEADAESLRQELGEDRWLVVFRNAGSQAQKMFESVERSIAKLQESLETGAHVHNPGMLSKRIESYEAKKVHYVPAIERVVSIIEKGVNDRLTVNGAVTRLLSDMVSRTNALKTSIKVMDSSLEDINISRSTHLRDSISSIITMDSPVTGSAVETPGSSPASSVVMQPGMKGASTPVGSSRRGSSVGSAARTTMSKVRRQSGVPQPSSNLSSRKSSIPQPALSPSSAKSSLATPTPATRKASNQKTPARPRWNGSTNTSGLDVGHNFRPMSPSSNRKSSLPTRPSRPSSTIPLRSPFLRETSASPLPSAPRTTSRVSSRLTSRSPGRAPLSPTPARSILDPPPYSKLRRPAPGFNTGTSANTPRSRQSFAGTGTFSRSVSHENAVSSPTTTRPGTSLGHSGGRRTSLLPMPKTRARESAQNKLNQRPPWR